MYLVKYTSHKYAALEPIGCNAENYYPLERKEEAVYFANSHNTSPQLVYVPSTIF